MDMTTNHASEIHELNVRIRDIKAAAFGMNVPVNAGQALRIAEYERQIAELEEGR